EASRGREQRARGEHVGGRVDVALAVADRLEQGRGGPPGQAALHPLVQAEDRAVHVLRGQALLCHVRADRQVKLERRGRVQLGGGGVRLLPRRGQLRGGGELPRLVLGGVVARVVDDELVGCHVRPDVVEGVVVPDAGDDDRDRGDEHRERDRRERGTRPGPVPCQVAQRQPGGQRG